MQILMKRDAELRLILERDEHLNDVKFENIQQINGSLEKVKFFIDSPPTQIQENNTTTIKRNYSMGRKDNDMDNNKGMINSNIDIRRSNSEINPKMSINMNKINQEEDMKISQDNINHQNMDDEQDLNIQGNEAEIDQENEHDNEQEN